MSFKQWRLAALAIGAGLTIGGCTDGYGYGGLATGYGAYGYDDGYGYGYDGYGEPGFGYGGLSSYFGWYNDFYYPGTGVYVYDRYRRPFRWNNNQRQYWQGRQSGYRGNRNELRNNWNGFATRPGGSYGDRYRGGTNGYYRQNGNATPPAAGVQPYGDRSQGRRGNDGYRSRQYRAVPPTTAGQGGYERPATSGATGARSWGGGRGGRDGGYRGRGRR